MRRHFAPKNNYLFLFLLTAEPLPGERSGYNLSNYTPNLATLIHESLCVYSLMPAGREVVTLLSLKIEDR